MVNTPRLVLGIDKFFLHGDEGLGWLGIGSAGTATGIRSCWTAQALFSLGAGGESRGSFSLSFHDFANKNSYFMVDF